MEERSSKSMRIGTDWAMFAGEPSMRRLGDLAGAFAAASFLSFAADWQ